MLVEQADSHRRQRICGFGSGLEESLRPAFYTERSARGTVKPAALFRS